jgi:lipopolysaccharide biosynthesis glycosyltransferase
MENKRNLLVTLADSRYIEQAKQLFSSVYWNAGWSGDYMLLAHEIPEEELKWFSNKGIFITRCMPLYNKKIGKGHDPVILDKFYVFSSEFKKWNNVIFIDSDIIVKGSLNRLTKIRGLGAANSTLKLAKQFSSESDLYTEIKKKYNIRKKTFNTGIMAFSTDIIHDDLLKKLVELFERYESIAFWDESILNLYFYNNWIKIPRAFNNFYISFFIVHKLKIHKIKSIVFHFMGTYIDGKYTETSKPWNPGNPFYPEWISNLERAEITNFNESKNINEWNFFKIKYHSLLINTIAHALISYIKIAHSSFRYKMVSFFRFTLKSYFIYLINTPDKLIGKIGICIKKYNPYLYNKLKKPKK